MSEQPAFASDDKRTDGVLTSIIVERHVAAREEGVELRSPAQRVVNGLAEQAGGSTCGASTSMVFVRCAGD